MTLATALRALIAAGEKATPGEWTGVKTFVENGRAYLCVSPRHLIFAADDDERIQPGTATEANADFIALAANIRPLLPALLELVEESERQIETRTPAGQE